MCDNKRKCESEPSVPQKRIKIAQPAPEKPPRPKPFQQCFDELPAELKNIVQDYTFTAESKHQSITKAYRPPSALSVSSSTRQIFAASYYSSTTFYCPTKGVFRRWVKSLTRQNREKVRTIRLQLEDPASHRPAKAKSTGGTAKNAVHEKEGSDSSRHHKPDYANHALAGRAAARLFFARGNRKAKIHVKPGVTLVNLKFDYWEEKWTANPGKEYQAWKKWKRKEVGRIYLEWAAQQPRR